MSFSVIKIAQEMQQFKVIIVESPQLLLIGIWTVGFNIINYSVKTLLLLYSLYINFK